MSWIKKIIKWLSYLFYLLVSSIVLLEIIFRVLPTAEVFKLQEVTLENPIIRYEPNKQSAYSIGWNFYQRADKQTNNYGFVASKNYTKGGAPDVMVIGDSYVEALQVDNNEALPEIIEQLDDNLDVYAMAISAISLSQYIKYIEFAEEEFDPKEYLIVVVGNDFDESLCSYKRKQGTYCFDENFELQIIPFPGYSTIRNLARSSAVMRYVVFNLSISWRHIMSKLKIKDPGLSDKHEYAGNTERKKNAEIEALSFKVVDEFVSRISSIVNGKKVTLLIDADKSDIYAGRKSDSYFNTMRTYLMEKATTEGVGVIDMHPIFEGHFQQFGKLFDFPTDGHWNELGHELAAKAYLGGKN